MSTLINKLRELAELQTKLRSETRTGVPWAYRDRAFRDACTLTYFAALLAEAERLEAQNRRLRELVREAYCEGFDDGESDAISLSYRSTGVDQSWDVSSAKAALDVMDKEGADASSDT